MKGRLFSFPASPCISRAGRVRLFLFSFHYILARGDCFTIKDLDISGNDLIEYGLQGHEIGETLKSLLDIVIENPKLNDKATLIAMIEHIK